MRGRTSVAATVRCGLRPSGKEPVLIFRRSIAIVALVTAACSGGGASSRAAVWVDDFGDTVRLAAPASRIASLNPVTTEILFALGAGDRVVGRTHWDLYPPAARLVQDLGNGMQPDVEAVLGARPDLVVLYASGANRGAATRLRHAGIETVSIRTDRVADFSRAVAVLARLTGDTAAGRVLVDSVERSLAAVRAMPRPAKPPTVFWEMWSPPVLTIGRDSYLTELVVDAGAVNVFGDLPGASPQISMEEIVRRNPDFVLVGPESVARIRSSPVWRAIPAVRSGRILVVDTTLVGRPGPRLGEAAHSLRALIFGADRR